jgi:U3 small nucleolar RNA-associated protein 22
MAGIRAKRKHGETASGIQDSAKAYQESDRASMSDEPSAAVDQGTPKKRKRVNLGAGQSHFVSGTFVGEVYRSNMFKLQVDELLSQLKPNLNHLENSVNAALHNLKSIIEAIPEKEPATVCHLNFYMSKGLTAHIDYRSREDVDENRENHHSFS